MEACDTEKVGSGTSVITCSAQEGRNYREGKDFSERAGKSGTKKIGMDFPA